MMESIAVVTLALFIVTIIVLAIQKTNETATALFAMCVAGGVLYLNMSISFAEYVSLIQWDVILFVSAMMIFVSVAGASGMFQYTALLLVRSSRGEPRRILVIFMSFVFVISLFFDPLPTMIIMGPVTLEVCRALKLDFRPFLISEVIVANIASIPSVVGSIPNLVIVSRIGIDGGFMFLTLLPLALILLIVTILFLFRYYRDELTDKQVVDVTYLFMIRPTTMIKSKRDFYLSIVALIILIIGFTVGPSMEVEASFVALLVASGLLILSQERARDLLRSLSWDTVFFLVGLFGLITAMEVTGVIEFLVTTTGAILGNNIFAAILFLIWIPGFVLAIIDNIPVATLLAPLAVEFGTINQVVPLSLLIGANVGGYMIPFGDAPNMIIVGLAEDGGNPISFKEFTKVALPLGFLHLLIASAYTFLMTLFFM